MAKPILLPLFYKYYLFDYYQNIVSELLSRGYTVELLYIQPKIKEQYESFENQGLTFKSLPRTLRFLLNRSGKPFFRVLLWLFGWPWGVSQKIKYSFVLVPWDYKPLWFILGKLIPSLTNDVVTNFVNLEMREKADKQNRAEDRGDKLIGWYEKYSGRNLKPRLQGVVMKYNSKNLIVDWFMGKKTQSNFPGFGGADLLTVTGAKIKENYITAGLKQEKVHIVGNPGYDDVVRFANEFKETDKEKFLLENNINSDHVVSLFLSPSSYSEDQIKEIHEVIATINKTLESNHFIIKFHPKTGKGEHERVLSPLYKLGVNITEIRAFSGDIENAQIMLSSDFLVQKQCTLGFLAMVLKIPMISYNMIETDYEDDMYKFLNASLHCENKIELEKSLSRIMMREELMALRQLQTKACELFCLSTPEASKKIVDIIEKQLRYK